MTLDHGGAALPPAEEAGVLFGFGRTGPPIGSEFAKAWKYQAPSPPAELAQEKILERSRRIEPHWPATWSDGSTWDLGFGLQQGPAKTEARLEEFLEIPEQRMEDDHSRLEKLLGSLQEGQALTESWLESVMNVLETNVQESGADDLISVIEALKSYSVSLDSWEAFASILKQNLVLGTASNEEVVRIFKLILERTDDWEAASLNLATRIGCTGSADALLDVLGYIINSPMCESKTKTWLAFVKSYHPAIRDGRLNSSSWQKLYGLLSQHFQPSHPCVIDHFGKLMRTEFAQVLLEFYLPAWIDPRGTRVQTRNANKNMREIHTLEMITEHGSLETWNSSQEAVLGSTDFRYMDYGSFKGVDTPFGHASSATNSTTIDTRPSNGSALSLNQRLKYVKARWKWLFRSRQRQSPDDRINTNSYATVNLVRLLRKYNVPYARLLYEVFEVYMQTQNTKTTKNFFLHLRAQGACAIPTTVAGKLVHHFIAADNIDYAFYIFHNVPTLPLLPYSELLLKLIKGGKTHGEKIFEMLERYHPEERLPMEQRLHSRLNLRPEHINLVHKVAYAFASSEHLSPRTAFRRVWESFRYLRDRKAPLQPLMSRAFVKAGISRPLKERQRLNEEQVKYIVSIVTQIEGAQIAREIDRIVWDSWNWHLEKQWSLSQTQPPKGPAGQGRFYENRRRLWIEGGGRVYMPFPEAVSAAEMEAVNIDNEAGRQSISPDDIKSISARVDPLNGHVERYNPLGISMSLTDMNKSFDQLHYSDAQPREHTTDESRIIDSEDSELSLAEMNEVLEAPSGESSCVKPSALGQTSALEALTKRMADTVNTSYSNDSADSGEYNTLPDIVADGPMERLDSRVERLSGSGVLQKRLSLLGPVSFRHFQLWKEKPIEFRKQPPTVPIAAIPESTCFESTSDAEDVVEPANFTLTYERKGPKRVYLRYQ